MIIKPLQSYKIVFSIMVGALLLLGSLPCISYCMTPADREKYEKLGLSETEWGMILDAKMPMSKVQELLRDGISIPEYFNQPWIDANMSEGEWIAKRKSGLSTKDIYLLKAAKPKSHEGEGLIPGFLLPGSQQLMRGQKLKGWTMLGAAVGFTALVIVHSISAKSFQPVGLFLLVPDMVWSGIDIGIQINKEQNPGATRFTNSYIPNAIGISASISFP